MNRRQFLLNATTAASLIYAAPTADPQVKRVLVMFKCHLDVGFVDTQAAIIKKYFDVYFPQAIQLAADLRAARRRSLHLDHRFLAHLSISRTSRTSRTQADGTRAHPRRHRLARSALHLANRTARPQLHRRRYRLFKFARLAIRQEDHWRQNDRCSGTLAWVDSSPCVLGRHASGYRRQFG